MGDDSGTSGQLGCGDGVQQADEACDDGNDVNADGCNNDCTISGSILWERSYDGQTDDRARSLTVNENDEILLFGLTGEAMNRVCSDWMRLYDANGAPLQSGQAPADYCSVAFVADDRYAGYRSSTFQNGNPDAAGEFGLSGHTISGVQLWTMNLDYTRLVGRVAADGAGIMVGGSAGQDNSSIFYWSVGYVLEVSNGAVQWEDGIPNAPPPQPDAFERHECGPVAAAEGARFAVCFSEGTPEPVLYRYNESGTLGYSVEFAGSTQTGIGGYAVDATDEGVVLVGAYDEVFVFALNGTETDHFIYTGPGDVRIDDVRVDGDGNLVLAGTQNSESGGGLRDIFLRKTAPSGDLLWELTHPAATSPVHVELLSDDSIVVFGAEPAGGGGDLWIARVAP